MEPNSWPLCTMGTCGIACSAGFANCNGVTADGCEVNVQTDPNNCGGCGKTCVAPNATMACTMGACRMATCNAGFADCNGLAADRCETNLQTDPNNCGTCGTRCVMTCAMGHCNP